MDWFYAEKGEQRGPVTLEALKGLIEDGSVDRNALVWREGMENWKPASETEEFAATASRLPVPGGAQGAPALPPKQAPLDQPPALDHGPGRLVPNYLWQSIVVTLLCCLPLGIPAIVYAAKVDTLLGAGDIQAARDASEKAKMWCWIAFGAGLAGGLLYFLLIISSTTTV